MNHSYLALGMNRPRPCMRPLLWLLLATSLPAFAAGPAWPEYLKKPDSWFATPEGRRSVENVLSWQSPLGSWPKNTNAVAQPYSGDTNQIHGTFDNGATTGEMRFLARAFRAAHDVRAQAAVRRGLDHILKAQYPTGGWPQSFPPGSQYHRHITFNDDAMVRLMNFLREVASSADFEFLPASEKKAAQAAFDRGIECILKCQIAVNGKLTVWCAQHDERSLEPRSARTFELVSLSGAESAGILLLLMSLENPDDPVKRAIRAGAEWFESAKLLGIRQTRENGNKVIVKDPNAAPLWARFYEIETNRPIFSGRDSVKKYDIAEIETERRNGYAWYGEWGTRVARAYTDWQNKSKSK